MIANDWEQRSVDSAVLTKSSSTESTDPELRRALEVHQRIEGLFGLLRQPAGTLALADDERLRTGSTLGDFRIIRRLGAGGMGQVFLARQESLGRLVALKVCKPEITNDDSLRRRFETEGQALAQLRHPHVVPVIMTGEHEGLLYLVMEYVPGYSLAELFQAIRSASADSSASSVVAEILDGARSASSCDSWSEDHAVLDRAYHAWIVQVLRKVAAGLAAIHEAGILHRDLKPENVVLDHTGQPRIVDFGLARIEAASSVTVSGEFLGTPAYASPEQARGENATMSPASDVFSFGIILFESLSLRRPFTGLSPVDTLNSVLHDDAPLLRKVDRRTPWELEAIADKCLQKDPEKRYSSAWPVAEDLERYLDRRPISARRSTVFRRVARHVQRRPWACTFFLALAIAVVLSSISAVNARQNHLRQQHAARQERFDRLVAKGDAALFRALVAPRPTWLPHIIEQTRREAIDSYTAAIEIDPDSVWPLVQRGRLYESREETLEHALADFRRARQLQPGYASIPRLQAIVLDHLGKTSEADELREIARSILPRTNDDLYWLGHVTGTEDKDWGRAYRYYTDCLLLEPNHYWARLERVLFGSKNDSPATLAATEQRLAELKVAETLRPDLPFASECLVLYMEAVDREAAYQELRELRHRVKIS